MPNYPQATFEYTGGIGGAYGPVLGGWRVTVTHGMTPSIINVSVPMVAGAEPPQKNGDVILRYGDAKPIKLKNCTIDKITQDVGGRLIWNVVILDRRFRWRWADISGWWNARWRNGTDVRTETQKKPSELAKIFLEAMGETDYDIKALKQFDGTDWPEFQPDVTNAAEMLQQLCERYELRPVWDWDKDRVVVVEVGKGRELDLKQSYTQYSLTYDPPEKPGRIVVLCAPSSVQYDFPLEHVMLDWDGTIRYPNQVSYAPLPPQTVNAANQGADFKAGTYIDEHWAEWAPYSANLIESVKYPALRRLAEESLLRWYRIVPPKVMDGLYKIAGDNPKYRPLAGSSNSNLGIFTHLSEDKEKSWLWDIDLQMEQNDRNLSLFDPLNTQFIADDEYNKEVSQAPLPAWIYGLFSSNIIGGNNLPYDYDVQPSPLGGFVNYGPKLLSAIKKLNPAVVTSSVQLSTSPMPDNRPPDAVQAAVARSGFYEGGFSLDVQRGIVKFGERVFQSAPPKHPQLLYKFANGGSLDPATSNGFYPATLFLRTRFFVRDKSTRAPIRYQKTRVLDAKNDTVRYVVRNDLTYKLTYRFDAKVNPINLVDYPPSFQSTTTEDNRQAMDKALDGYLDAIEAQYETRQPATIVYPGFSPWTLDGAIRQVTWEVDGSGKAFTRVSRDTEELHIVRDFVERRMAERLRNLANNLVDPRWAEANRQLRRGAIAEGKIDNLTGIG